MSKNADQSKSDLAELNRAVSVIAPSGRESEAIAVIRDMIESRPRLQLSCDSFGNVIIRHRRETSGAPLFFSAHIDHPALVITATENECIFAEYRGGSEAVCEIGAEVLIAGRSGDLRLRIIGIEQSGTASPLLRLSQHEDVAIGDVGTLTPSRIQFACDDMAGVCALIHAMDRVDERNLPSPIRLVLTRAEEIGMIGAIGACRNGVIPAGSRVIAVDARNERCSDKLLVSLRDRTGPVSPRLAMECIRQGCEIDDGFISATEAGVYGAFGFESVAVTYPIDHMHNINGKSITQEHLEVEVYKRLVDIIVLLMTNVSREASRETLSKHFDRNMPLINE